MQLPSIKLPSIAVVAIGAALGALVAVNNEVLHLGAPWQVGLNTTLAIGGVLGISIVSGPQFQTIIRLPQAVCAAVAAALGGVQLLLAQSGIDPTWRTVAQALLVVAGTLGFGPTVSVAAQRVIVAARSGVTARGGVDS